MSRGSNARILSPRIEGEAERVHDFARRRRRRNRTGHRTRARSWMFERGEEQARKHGRRYIGRRQMFRACDLRAVLAGLVLCGIAADEAAAAQDGAETTEDLGYAYALARRTTAQGTIIETLLYAGR